MTSRSLLAALAVSSLLAVSRAQNDGSVPVDPAPSLPVCGKIHAHPFTSPALDNHGPATAVYEKVIRYSGASPFLASGN